ncbi:unnamed protein product [Bursaphelenchus xylophilus]|uniref:(pine wood nematode) hypothetical protein n=1 Tax=Bursaphelenchus xylophilus TaxID=6326 RepID=A0A811LCA8_BURXY|nr:unnamed protein product [Bursaphelenchus xylophilus]CAG9113723.1 unnamed protein product [Bursaphelenchus xylophilus]
MRKASHTLYPGSCHPTQNAYVRFRIDDIAYSKTSTVVPTGIVMWLLDSLVPNWMNSGVFPYYSSLVAPKANMPQLPGLDTCVFVAPIFYTGTLSFGHLIGLSRR